MMDVAASEMFLLRMLCRRLDMLIVLGSFPMDEELCCAVESVPLAISLKRIENSTQQDQRNQCDEVLRFVFTHQALLLLRLLT